MTERFKLITNAQESKIFKSNVTTIKIKCSNNFPRPYSVEITHTSLEQSENFTIYTSENGSSQARKFTLQMTHSDWSNLLTNTAWRRLECFTFYDSLILRHLTWGSMSDSLVLGKVPRVWFHVFVSFIKDFLWLLTSTTFKACLQGLRVTLVLGVP